MNKLFLSVAFFCFAARIYAGSATWLASPTSGDWNTPTNWSPATVPNAQTDIATFATSAVTQVSLSSSVSLDSMIFNPGADSFSITGPATTFFFYGDGVVNNSGQTQTFTFTAGGGAAFYNSSAGDNVSYLMSGGAGATFLNKASAGTANFTLQADAPTFSTIYFFGDSEDGIPTAGNASFTLLPRGFVVFGDGGRQETPRSTWPAVC